MRAQPQTYAPAPRRSRRAAKYTRPPGPIEIEIEDFHNFTDCFITEAGSENLYFMYHGKEYFCKFW